ncbi:MAG: hypothetical protein HKN52_10905 [Eudoraea sp.]|nr:hypothetical protein [Muriicola sp.]NNE03662.1 hypothetical protein [Eudoraea sp.]
MKKIIQLFFLFYASILFAQQMGTPAPQMGLAENDPAANFQRWNPMMQKLFQQVRDDDGVVTHYVGAEVGSPYEYEDFKKGKVYYDEEYLGEFYYRLNLFSNEIEVKRTFLEEENYKALIANEKVSLVSNEGKEYRFMTFKDDKNNTESGYITKLLNGSEYKLYKRIVAKYTEAKPAANSMVNPIPSKFTQFTEYYLKQGASDDIVELPTKKGKMLKVFDNAVAKELKEFMAQEDINLNLEKDVIKIIAFLDAANLN